MGVLMTTRTRTYANGRRLVLQDGIETEEVGCADCQKPRQGWDVSQPSRGLGDTVAKLTHATGIDRLVKKITRGKDCGCKKRQNKLNQRHPYKTARV